MSTVMLMLSYILVGYVCFWFGVRKMASKVGRTLTLMGLDSEFVHRSKEIDRLTREYEEAQK